MATGGLYWNKSVPFSDEIMSCRFPSDLPLLNIEYDGTTDPWDHLLRFESFDQLYPRSDEFKCRLFITTLTKSALRWFHQLPAKSIRNFDQLCSAFMKQFRIFHRKYENTLGNMKQKKGETLRSYVERFGKAAVKMPSATEDELVRVLIKGLRDQGGKLHRSLCSSKDRSLDGLMDLIERHFDIDEDEWYCDSDEDQWRGHLV